MFEIARLEKAAILPAIFTSKFQYAVESDERGQVAQVVKRAARNQCRIYALRNDSKLYGFTALSLAVLAELPVLVVDYLFTSAEFRGMTFKELENSKVADHLLAFALRSAATVNEIAPIRFLALLPANENLDAFYRRRGFSKLDSTEWMFLKVPQVLAV